MVELFFARFMELLTAPIRVPNMFWIILPLLLIIVLMTVYFAKYKDEELGWNTALSNSFILIFVSVDLFRNIFSDGRSIGAIILVSLLLLEGIVLMFVNFNHFLPKKIGYFLSSPLPINLTAYVMITLIYSMVPIDIYSILAALLLLIILLGFFLGIGYISKKWWTRVERLKSKEPVKNVRKEKEILEVKKKELKKDEKKIKQAVKKKEKEVVAKKQELKKFKEVASK
tara:strand:- start:22694 stop:23377 length:684 start_codon:yes stop_codon:yes gene_type:complete